MRKNPKAGFSWSNFFLGISAALAIAVLFALFFPWNIALNRSTRSTRPIDPLEWQVTDGAFLIDAATGEITVRSTHHGAQGEFKPPRGYRYLELEVRIPKMGMYSSTLWVCVRYYLDLCDSYWISPDAEFLNRMASFGTDHNIIVPAGEWQRIRIPLDPRHQHPGQIPKEIRITHFGDLFEETSASFRNVTLVP